MPTTTWPTARADVLRPLGLIEFSTTTNLAGSAVIVSTTLAKRYPVDDTFNGWYVYIENNNNAGEIRRVTDYTASSGTLTVAGANFSSDSGATKVDLMRFNYETVLDHFTRAQQHPSLQHICSIVRDLDTVIGGQRQGFYTLPSTLRGKPIQIWVGRRIPAESISENEITDPSFENWTNATSPVSWTVAGSGSTVNQEEHGSGPENYMVLEGSSSARVLSNASDETTLLQTVTPSVSTQAVEASLSVWVYSTVASRVTARIASTDSSVHGGTGWERLTVSANIGEATTVSVGIAVSTGTAYSCYVDEIVLVMGQSEIAEASLAPILNWEWTPPAAGASNGGTLRFPYELHEHTRLRIIGRDLLSTLSSETSTIEIDGPLLEPLYQNTRELICEEAAATGPVDQSGFWLGLQRHWRTKFDDAIAGAITSGTPNPRANIPDWGVSSGASRQGVQDPAI